MIALARLLAACASGGVPDVMAPLPQDAAAALSVCEEQAFPELEITCRVEAAARAAQQGKSELGEAACAGISIQVWQEECHFRVGEEAGRAGRSAEALSHCSRAGSFRPFCLTHLTWQTRVEGPTWSFGEAGTGVAAAVEAQVRQATEGVDDPSFRVQAQAALTARTWFEVYYGRGEANPAAALAVSHRSGGAAARTAFALEALRLGAEVHELGEIWRGDAAVPVGPALPPGRRHGRYHPPMPWPEEGAQTWSATYGGGRRLASDDVELDLVLAGLAALYFDPEIDASQFLPFLTHPAVDARRVAVQMIRVTPSTSLNHQETLGELLGSDDGVTSAIAREGLRLREWTVFTGGPPPPRR